MPKQPQDHLEKSVKPKVERTEAGFKVTHGGVDLLIDVDALNDFELLRDLGKMQDPAAPDATRLSRVTSVFDRFFGEVQGARVLNALRNPDTGRVTVEAATTYLFEVFGALNPES